MKYIWIERICNGNVCNITERPSLTTRPLPTTTSTTTTTTSTQDWKKSDMYGSKLNEFDENINFKRRKEDYRYETTSSKDFL